MRWTQNHIDRFFQTDEAFVENYCDDLTLAPFGDAAVRSRSRLLAKRLAVLMPNGAHRSPGFSINPRPWLVVSCATGPALTNMDGNWRVAAFYSNHEFYVGFHLQKDAIRNLEGLRLPVEIRGRLNHYNNWTDIGPGNDHLCIQIEVPENGEFTGMHPLADGQPLALTLQSINAIRFSQVPAEWYSNYLVARGEPANGVIVPSVTRLEIL